jgi:hypothetical protein
MPRGSCEGRRSWPNAALAALMPAILACGGVISPRAPGGAEPARTAEDGGLAGATRVDIRLPRGDRPDFNTLPWPSELFRAENGNGSIDWHTFPGAGHPLLASYFAAAKADLSDFPIAPTIYFHFTAGPDRSRLSMRPEASMSLRSPVFLIDVDPKSPERGSLIPLESRYFASSLRYIPARTLALKPIAGFVLRPGTLYAAIIRRDLGDREERPLGTTPDFEQIKSPRPVSDAAAERARSIHSVAFDYLTSLGVQRDDIAAAALFRTLVPHTIADKLFDVATSLPPSLSPRLLGGSWARPAKTAFAERKSYSTMVGYYCTPSFQSRLDDAPFLSGGGTLDLDESRSPRVVPVPESSRFRTASCGDLIRARYILTIPKTSMPEGGYPLLVAAHGTGGSATDFLGEDNFAGWAAREGIAAVSTDQPLHGSADPEGARPGSRERRGFRIAGIPLSLFRGQPLGADLAFYNPLNPAATRDNLRQAAIDASLLARLLMATDFATAEKPDSKKPQKLLAPIPGQAPPRFDKTKILFAGHSQGSQSLAVQAAIDPLVRGVILSGCGGDARLGIVRRRDLTIMSFIETALALEDGELNEFHPLMALVQALIDPVDPQSFARLYRDPLPGRNPQNVLHYGGLTDTYNPPEAASALATALRAAPLSPLLVQVPGLRILGITPTEGLLRGNIAGGRATAAFVQLASTRGEDGHFVVFNEPPAADLAMQFMRSAIAPAAGPAEVGPLADPLSSRR